MAKERQRLDEIQMTRAFAIFAVVLVHTTSTGVSQLATDSGSFVLYNVLNTAGKLGTPTFIMLSSFVLFYNYHDRHVDKALLKRFYTKRLKYILFPYLLFSILYFTVNRGWQGADALTTFFIELATGKAHAHLYFVFISVQFYLVFPLILLLFQRSKTLAKNAFWIGIVLQWIWVILNKHYFQIEWKGSIAFSYLSYYFIGAFLGIYYQQLKSLEWVKKGKGVLILFYVVSLVAYSGYIYSTRTGFYQSDIQEKLPSIIQAYVAEFTWAFYTLFASVLLFVATHWIIKRMSPLVKSVWMEIGAVSFGIYLVHPLLLKIIRLVPVSGDPVIYHSFQVATFLIVFMASWAIVRGVYYCTKLYWIPFGHIPKSPWKK